MTEPQFGGTYDQLLAAAKAAEKAGLVSFARSDHIYWEREPAAAALDAFTSIGGLARDTKDIRLCVMVTPVTFRHPSMILKAATTASAMSDGRFDLGVGTGWNEFEHRAFGLDFPDWTERFARLEDALRYIRAGLSGESYTGTHYSIEADSLPRPERMPLIVGGSGKERTPRLAARYADEYNHFIALASEIGPKVQLLREAAAELGRSNGDVLISVMGPAHVRPSREEYEQALSTTAASRGMQPSALQERWDSIGVPCGTPEDAAPVISALRQAGVDRYYLQWVDITDTTGLEANIAAMKETISLAS
ncbi:MAG TPA: LLM class flavin-dependent oxidoreductase [Acidimicrobiia bacterium]